jgi:hypothetical protein
MTLVEGVDVGEVLGDGNWLGRSGPAWHVWRLGISRRDEKHQKATWSLSTVKGYGSSRATHHSDSVLMNSFAKPA